MDQKTAIDLLEDIMQGEGTVFEVSKQLAMAAEAAIAALEIQIPMKVKEIHVDEYFCPACGSENNCNDGIVGDAFCPECGQALYHEN